MRLVSIYLLRVNRLFSFAEDITSLQSILPDFYHIHEAPRPKSDLPMHDLIWKVGAIRNDQDPIATKQLFINYNANIFLKFVIHHIYMYRYPFREKAAI